jgi:agmatinase
MTPDKRFSYKRGRSMSFDPNGTSLEGSGLFGLPFDKEQCRLHILPVPWEVTTSYGAGASRGPDAILNASYQVDLFDIETGDTYTHGYHLLPMPTDIAVKNFEMKTKAREVLEYIETGREHEATPQTLQKEINSASEMVNEFVYRASKETLSSGRIPAVLGGDHSTPFGLIRAVAESTGGDFGVLHIDAHADLRDAYQGYTNSHASIMHNVMEKLSPKALVQVGIRDFSQGEFEYIQKNKGRIHTYFDLPLKHRLNRGETWQALCKEIVSHLPKNVHISFDIDGLTPDLCPNTGTPVPGGLSYDQALMLLTTVAESGRRIVGFDLTEVAAPEGSESEWDGNVGARLLFKLCGWTMITNGHKPTVGVN